MEVTNEPHTLNQTITLSGTCPVCHQPISPQYYFCPNCGAPLHEAPLSTSLATQAWIYAFSVVLPLILFIFITKWPGWKYYKSEDPKAKTIGTTAIMLIVLSTLITTWLAYVWMQGVIQSSVNSVNSSLTGY